MGQVLAGNHTTAVPLLESLVRDVVDLVNRELPRFDTTAVRRRIHFRPGGWSIQSAGNA